MTIRTADDDYTPAERAALARGEQLVNPTTNSYFTIDGPFGIGLKTTRLYYTVKLVQDGRRSATLAQCRTLSSAIRWAKRERTIRQLNVEIYNNGY